MKLQALAPKWKLDSAGRRVVEPKDVTKEKIGRSPDDMDAVNLAYLDDWRWEAPTVLDEPVSVSIVVVLPRPAYLSRVSKRTGEPLQPPERVPHVSRPDCDNLAKSVLDGMSGWWRDDCIVQRLVVEKWAAACGEQTHYEVTVCADEVKSCPP